jgi:hypothetical protein
MTFAGKLFVMLNVALSLLFAAGAFGMYVTGMDWSYDPAKPGTPGGILKTLEDEIKRDRDMQYYVENSWRQAREELRRREEARRGERQFYVVQFDFNRNKATADNPARIVDVDPKTHLPKLDKQGRPVLVAASDRFGKPLQSVIEYEKQLDRAHRDNVALLDDLKKEIQEDIRLTNLLVDAPGRKGLRTQLVEERAKREGLIAEVQLVRPLDVNADAESELVKKRMDSQAERIKELENYIKKRNIGAALTRR